MAKQGVADHLPMMNGPTVEPNICQKTLVTRAPLDVEVRNGGLLQLFWNCPGWLGEVSPSLRSLDLSSLATVFERPIADHVGDFGTYSEFRKRDTLEAYSECAAKFDFCKFDSAYYDKEEQVNATAIAIVTEYMAVFVVDSSWGGEPVCLHSNNA